MTDLQFTQFQKGMEEAVERQIKTTVNGKIDGLRAYVEAYVKLDTNWKENDKAWKTDAQPSIDLGKNVSWGGKLIAGLIGVGAGMVAIGAGVVKFVEFIKK